MQTVRVADQVRPACQSASQWDTEAEQQRQRQSQYNLQRPTTIVIAQQTNIKTMTKWLMMRIIMMMMFVMMALMRFCTKAFAIQSFRPFSMYFMYRRQREFVVIFSTFYFIELLNEMSARSQNKLPNAMGSINSHDKVTKWQFETKCV